MKTLDQADFVPTTIASGVFQGTQYALPVDCNVQLLVYRKDLLEQKGLKPPATWDELVAAARALHDPGKEKYGIAITASSDIQTALYMLVAQWSYGAELVDASGRGSLNTPAGRKGGEVFLELLKFTPPNVRSYNFADVNKVVQLGQAAMAIQWASGARPMEDKTRSTVAGKLGYTMVPKAVRQTPMRGVWTAAIAKNSANQDAAWQSPPAAPARNWAGRRQVSQRHLAIHSSRFSVLRVRRQARRCPTSRHAARRACRSPRSGHACGSYADIQENLRVTAGKLTAGERTLGRRAQGDLTRGQIPDPRRNIRRAGGRMAVGGAGRWFLLPGLIFLFRSTCPAPVLGLDQLLRLVADPAAGRRFVGLANYLRLAADPSSPARSSSPLFTTRRRAGRFLAGLDGLAVRAAVPLPPADPCLAPPAAPSSCPVVGATMWASSSIPRWASSTTTWPRRLARPPASDPTLALVSITLVDAWRTIPFMFLCDVRRPRGAAGRAVRGRGGGRASGLAGLPTSPGCRGPRDIMLLAILIRGMDAFREFDIIFVLTGGGPGRPPRLSGSPPPGPFLARATWARPRDRMVTPALVAVMCFVLMRLARAARAGPDVRPTRLRATLTGLALLPILAWTLFPIYWITTASFKTESSPSMPSRPSGSSSPSSTTTRAS